MRVAQLNNCYDSLSPQRWFKQVLVPNHRDNHDQSEHWCYFCIFCIAERGSAGELGIGFRQTTTDPCYYSVFLAAGTSLNKTKQMEGKNHDIENTLCKKKTITKLHTKAFVVWPDF